MGYFSISFAGRLSDGMDCLHQMVDGPTVCLLLLLPHKALLVRGKVFEFV